MFCTDLFALCSCRYSAVQGVDHGGDDISCLQTLDASVAAAACDAQTACLAFNVDPVNQHSCIKMQVNVRPADASFCFFTRGECDFVSHAELSAMKIGNELV